MNPTLLPVFVVLGAVCACLAFVCWRKCVAVLNEARGIASALRSVRGKVETHDAELDRITDALTTLRGRFYAMRRTSQPDGSNSDNPPVPTAAATSKDELRRRIGLIAGKPAPHK